MIESGKRLHAQSTYYQRQVDFFLVEFDSAGKRQLATGIEFSDFPPGGDEARREHIGDLRKAAKLS